MHRVFGKGTASKLRTDFSAKFHTIPQFYNFLRAVKVGMSVTNHKRFFPPKSLKEDIFRMFSWYKNIISIVEIQCLRKIIIIGIVSIFVAEWQMGYVWGGIYQRQQHCFLEFKWRPFSLWSDPSNLKSLLTKEVAITILLRQPSKLLLIGETLLHCTVWNPWKKTTDPLV